MAITSVKIHPAIGVARLGNSPDEFFIGPERPGQFLDPAGGFKDAQCRVKRQAARFRIFAYHDDGTIQELTAADAQITWTVHLANKKAVTRNSGSAADLTIDPGPRTLNQPNQRKGFDNGTITLPGASAVTVPIGEVRTNDQSQLLVLGGFGTSASPTGASIGSFLDNAGWYDDIADGPVTATVTLHAFPGNTFNAEGAWVIVAPPKFAPQIQNVITLHDRVFQMAVSQGWLAGPAVPSYTNDIYPILQRARDTEWVVNVFGAHGWADPVYDPASLREMIFNRLANPGGGGGDMPELQSATLTTTQYEVMEKWKNNNFNRDWAGPPVPDAQVTPLGLDFVALGNCVGAAFYPGIEAGGIAATPIIDATKYVGAADPLRLNHAALSAGDISEFMALPWQADFKACGTNWWPVPRPNSVIPQGTTSYQAWDRGVGNYAAMVSDWNKLGFVIRQGNQYFEVDRCDMTFITLLTPHLNFQDVPQGPMNMSRKTALAIAFEVKSTGGAVTLEVQPGDGPSHLRFTLNASSVTVGPTVGNQIATARLWVINETGPVGESLVDQITVRHVASNRSWNITLSANTVPRKIAAAALVLDRSGSMSEDRGDGQTKHQSLKEAASIFVDVMVEGDGVGVVRYNQDAQPLQSITVLGPASDPFDTTRQNTKDIINGAGLTPSGATSIGDGIFEGRQILNASGPGFDVKSLVVLTDGKENRSRYITDVAAEINELTYAVGLGTPENTSAPALQTVSGNHGGYLLVTGAITGDNRFILQKYFLQILAGISNAEIVLDPSGELIPGREQRIPFLLTEADAGIDVILLTPHPKVVDFRLETPTGQIIQPWRALAEPGMDFVISKGVSYYRVVLPTELIRARFDHGGTWHALLNIGRPGLHRREPEEDRSRERIDQPRRIAPRSERGVVQPRFDFPTTHLPDDQEHRTIPYSLLVHSYSNLTMRTLLEQTGFESGARVSLQATLAESGVPAQPGAYVRADIQGPDNTSHVVDLNEVTQGQFSGSFTATGTGIYRCRIRASGESRAGYPFHREQTRTAAVWRGGDRDADPNSVGGGPVVRWLRERDEKLCRLISCLLGDKGALSPQLKKRLENEGVDVQGLLKCLTVYCRSQNTVDSEDTIMFEPTVNWLTAAELATEFVTRRGATERDVDR